jgi:L-amino acid N-acyltransferase YncA
VDYVLPADPEAPSGAHRYGNHCGPAVSRPVNHRDRGLALTTVQPVVRAAGPADMEQVAAIFAHYVTTSVTTFEEVPPTAAHWRQRRDDLAGQNLPFLVAEAEAAVCGFAYASPWRPKPAYRHTVEDTVYVSPGWTGRGLGGALLGALLAGCEQAGARQVIAVIADTGSDASAALHRRFGFTQAGRLTGVGRKQGRWIDTVLMQRELAAAR